MTHRAGDQVNSICNKCGGVTGHIVIAVIGQEIVKVECRACKGIHKYKPENPPKREKKETAHRIKAGDNRKEVISKQAAKDKPRPVSKSLKNALEIEEKWRRAIQLSVTSRNYSMVEKYAVGDIIEHPSFGKGMVQEIVSADKMKILFQDGIKLLKCAG